MFSIYELELVPHLFIAQCTVHIQHENKVRVELFHFVVILLFVVHFHRKSVYTLSVSLQFGPLCIILFCGICTIEALRLVSEHHRAARAMTTKAENKQKLNACDPKKLQTNERHIEMYKKKRRYPITVKHLFIFFRIVAILLLWFVLS